MKRHSRSDLFEASGRYRPDDIDPITGWAAVHDDPNHPSAVAHRSRTLAAAWRTPIPDRVRFLEDRVRGRNVLDIGCVAHATTRLTNDRWLHGRLARAAARCIGVDLLEEGVAAVVDAGFDAVVHDLSTGLGPLREHGPFDVIVAGELIEHITDLDMVFQTAERGLTQEGSLILTTPNPFSPQRVRAGQLGIVWENVDHVSYLFPSGIAELAARNGLMLLEAATTEPKRGRPGSTVQKIKRTIRGSHWRNVGFDSAHDGSPIPVEAGPFARLLRRYVMPQPHFIGETFIYVVGRPPL